MEETAIEQTTETTDAFLDGWDESETPIAEEADQPQQQEEAGENADSEAEEAQEKPAGNGEEAEAKPGAEADPTEQRQDAETKPQTWTLRHMGEEKTVNEQEMTALAQKGLDYDRIHEKYEEFRPVMELFNQFANKAGMSTKDYIAHIRQEAKKAEGMNASEAQRAVDLEDREATIAAKEAEEAERSRAQQEADARKMSEDARRMADIKEFQKTFPDAAKDPKGIPKEVWDGVRGGLSLVASYAKWQVDQAKKEAAEANHAVTAAKQNQKNAARTTGSMKSAGEESKSKDPFLQGWDS